MWGFYNKKVVEGLQSQEKELPAQIAKETDAAPDSLAVRLSPIGQVSGRPLAGSASAIRILNPVCGEMNLNLESAVMLDFNPSNNVIDDWDAEF